MTDDEILSECFSSLKVALPNTPLLILAAQHDDEGSTISCLSNTALEGQALILSESLSLVINSLISASNRTEH